MAQLCSNCAALCSVLTRLLGSQVANVQSKYSDEVNCKTELSSKLVIDLE